MYLGYRFSSDINELWAKAHAFQRYILIAIGVAIAMYLVYRFVLKRKTVPVIPPEKHVVPPPAASPEETSVP